MSRERCRLRGRRRSSHNCFSQSPGKCGCVGRRLGEGKGNVVPLLGRTLNV